MIKVNKKMLEEFLYIMDENNEFVFGNKQQIKEQLETVLNWQGYWSANYIKVCWDKKNKKFYVEERW